LEQTAIKKSGETMSLKLGSWLSVLAIVLTATASGNASDTDEALKAPHWVHVAAKDKFERSKIADLGVSIEMVMSDSVYGLASDNALKRIKESDLKLVESFRVNSKPRKLDFPSDDERFHNYAEMTKALDDLVAAHPKLMKKFSIGKSLQGREIWCVQINTSAAARENGDANTFSAKAGIVYMGNHHAREHVSAEIPLMYLEYLAKNYGVDRNLSDLIDKRDIYVIPMVNPDGVEFDIKGDEYHYHRKNMRENGTYKIGVDLNRNYGYKWGTGGASADPSDETYRGPTPFSEPETQAIKAFMIARPNVKMLLSYHTFSELILYPWGHTHSSVSDEADRKAFVTMAKKMAEWNGYKPQQSSELYIASGDTVDWAYGELKRFAFTFELSPRDMWSGGGFYPGATILDKVFQDNLKPALYLLEMAENPYRSYEEPENDRLFWLNQN